MKSFDICSVACWIFVIFVIISLLTQFMSGGVESFLCGNKVDDVHQ